MSIKIQVAVCTECKGYFSSAPLEQKNCSHPDVIDHFFYHGEPWFTLDLTTFEKFRNFEKSEIITTTLENHHQNDHQYCYCKKKKVAAPRKYVYEPVSTEKSIRYLEKNELETEIYFKDLYYTANNFHGIAAANHGNIAAKLR